MRKILAAVLATLMLVSAFAVLPMSAQTSTVSVKDGSTAADAEHDPADTEDAEGPESNNSVVWVAIAALGALVIIGVGGAVLFNFAKDKSDLEDEELSADEDDGFLSK